MKDRYNQYEDGLSGNRGYKGIYNMTDFFLRSFGIIFFRSVSIELVVQKLVETLVLISVISS